MTGGQELGVRSRVAASTKSGLMLLTDAIVRELTPLGSQIQGVARGAQSFYVTFAATQEKLSGTDFSVKPERVRRTGTPNNLGQKTSKIGKLFFHGPNLFQKNPAVMARFAWNRSRAYIRSNIAAMP